MPAFYVRRPVLIRWDEDEVHCADDCPNMERGADGARPKCRLWGVDLIEHEGGMILPPACRDARIADTSMDVLNRKVGDLMREIAELKAAHGDAIYCAHPHPPDCGRLAMVCTKDGPCDYQVRDGVRCQGFEGPCLRMDAKRRRQKTRYADDRRNWATYCPECQKAADEHWQERWDEYNAGRL